MEFFRGLGIEDEFVEASELEFEQNGAIVSVESLAGRELEYYFRNINEGVETAEPVTAALRHPDRPRADPA